MKKSKFTQKMIDHLLSKGWYWRKGDLSRFSYLVPADGDKRLGWATEWLSYNKDGRIPEWANKDLEDFNVVQSK